MPRIYKKYISFKGKKKNKQLTPCWGILSLTLSTVNIAGRARVTFMGRSDQLYGLKISHQSKVDELGGEVNVS